MELKVPTLRSLVRCCGGAAAAAPCCVRPPPGMLHSIFAGKRSKRVHTNQRAVAAELEAAALRALNRHLRFGSHPRDGDLELKVPTLILSGWAAARQQPLHAACAPHQAGHRLATVK